MLASNEYLAAWWASSRQGCALGMKSLASKTVRVRLARIAKPSKRVTVRLSKSYSYFGVNS